VETNQRRGPDADKRPPTVAEFLKSPPAVIATDFNEITLHPNELKRIMAERQAVELEAVELPAPIIEATSEKRRIK
jgi:hypothetical protein